MFYFSTTHRYVQWATLLRCPSSILPSYHPTTKLIAAGEATMNQSDDVWQETLNQLRLQMTRGTFDIWLATTKLLDVQRSLPDDTNLYIIEAASSMAVDWLENRLKETIIRTLAGVVGGPVQVEFVPREAAAYEPLDALSDAQREEPDEPDAEFEGVYYDQRNAIIQPDKVEVHSQYFRRKWRPLLGPLLSELIRELRQRCHYKTGRNTTKVTHKELARALGVSERTVYRALDRDETGSFKNKYLNYFIKDIQVLKRSDGRGKIRNLGTRFMIYLDEPLTPEDEAKIRD